MHPVKSGLLTVFMGSLTVYLWTFVKQLCNNKQFLSYVAKAMEYTLAMWSVVDYLWIWVKELCDTMQVTSCIAGTTDYLWVWVAKLWGNTTQVTSPIAWIVGYILAIFMLVNNLLSTVFSVVLLWLFGFLWIHILEEADRRVKGKKMVKVKNEERRLVGVKEVTDASANDSIVNAEKFIELFQVWLQEEESMATEVEPLEEKIYKMKSAQRQLQRVQIITDSLKKQTLHITNSNASEIRRIQQLLNKFYYIQAYMELRQHLLTTLQKEFSDFLAKGKKLKIWLSEALEFQETLHHLASNGQLDLQQQLSLAQVIRKQSEVTKAMLETYESSGDKLASTLQEMSGRTERFHELLQINGAQNGRKKWSDTLVSSVTEEMRQVSERFSTVLRLNSCYQTHLCGLQSRSIKAEPIVALPTDPPPSCPPNRQCTCM
ncbi:microtubule-actin cross-linking factor 1, isoforms 1/2/3/4/5-like [Hyperolius riggenbachi]|uniref:microtubule-actin cross-linking factor 1, isoforms 1/2/3/4/5-like n=1 Tax=Hyperolius riggenbachi TaxID=752182 RepID=UPI0035A26E88